MIGAVPWAWYAVDMFIAARERGREDPVTAGFHHYPVLGAAAIALVVLTVLMAIWPRGRFFVGLCVAVVATWFGATALAFPDADAAPSPFWSVAAVAWGVGIACMAVAEFVQARRKSPLPRR